MALPLSRDTSYAAGSQVFSADLNNLQDAVVSAAHGYKIERVHVSEGFKIDTAVGESIFGDFETISSANEEIRIPVRVPSGCVLDTVTVYGENLGAPGGTLPDVTLREFNLADYGGGPVSWSNITKALAEAGTGAWTVVFDSGDTGIPYTTEDAAHMQIEVVGQAATGTIRVYGLTFKYYIAV